MSRTVMRLAPSQAGGRLPSGILMAGGKSATGAIGVPCSLMVGSVSPLPLTVPQVEGAVPGNGVIVQQVTSPRTKIKPKTAAPVAIIQKMTRPADGRPSLIFLKLILFIAD